jgi:hypothetical protein
MNRRDFIWTLGIVLANCSHGRLAPNLWSRIDSETPTDLSEKLAQFSDCEFSGALKGHTADELTEALLRKRVLTRHGVDLERLSLLSRSEKLVGFQGKLYSPTELELYTLGRRLAEARTPPAGQQGGQPCSR